MSTEREVKLAVWPGFTLPDMDGVMDGVHAASLPDQDLDAIYYDTPDLRLTRWGISVRFRSGDDTGWTVKLPSEECGDASGEMVRRELNFGGQPDNVPTDVAHLLRGFTRTDPLRAVGRLRTWRRGIALIDDDGRRLAEIVDDEVSVYEDHRVAARFREVEVELTPAAPKGLAGAVVARLRAAGAGTPEPISKIVRVLGPRATEPPEVVATDVDRDGTMRDLIASSVSAGVTRLLRHDPGVRLGGDDEDVHQARVATRRLRSDLRSLRAYIQPDALLSLRDELKWLADALGAVRDADVLWDRLRADVAELDPRDRPDGAALLTHLGEERTAARTRLLKAMDSDRYVALVDRLVATAKEPPVVPEASSRADALAVEVVLAPWGHVRKAVEALGSEPADPALHDVRKRAKRARYAAEAVVPLLGKDARMFGRAMASVQEVLGDHQDAVVAEAWLRDAAANADARRSFAAGQLVARQRVRAAEARDEWRAVWAEASKKRTRAWLSS
jgi:CHAD domain-containing protein